MPPTPLVSSSIFASDYSGKVVREWPFLVLGGGFLFVHIYVWIRLLAYVNVVVFFFAFGLETAWTGTGSGLDGDVEHDGVSGGNKTTTSYETKTRPFFWVCLDLCVWAYVLNLGRLPQEYSCTPYSHCHPTCLPIYYSITPTDIRQKTGLLCALVWGHVPLGPLAPPP